MQIDVISIFPEYLDPLRHALLGRAIEQGTLQVRVHNLRQWATGVHQAVDSAPCGGGPGMVMKPDVWGPALDDVAQAHGPAAHADVWRSSLPHQRQQRHDQRQGYIPSGYDRPRDCTETEDPSLPLLLVPTPAGIPFTQAQAQTWSTESHIVFACGRYEGIDQRVFSDAQKRYRVREVSIGDYVLIGGEVATLVITEAIVRLIPGVLGNHQSHENDSFSDGLLEGPSFTKPRQWRGLDVPEILFSGNHANIDRWRRDQALLRTMQRRPDLLSTIELSPEDRRCLELGHSPVDDSHQPRG
ncbi:tRNA (guanosine(37)-N1)-methyltransferase TrmD [Corynebacterium poyangense]|uniref:tRNA (guanine-N(1)-)-methyltransferase n=1 Tax=Corynebacterium poyangense TaxID=2684405 RepID=A0A7H0SPK3_9CORY|nr:tRNA (guanosine(37)-N1)-methyltransferase TrmD [Corynebacterium poyangense]QNQ90478.1 tRNA (guanosine(37)-N1)-methyltransferase TrmD [Corynebacterium poyangense]